MYRKSTFNEKGYWLKGNTHAHTNISDGLMTPVELIETYRKLGYDFLAITDHDIYGIHDELDKPDFLVLPGVEVDMADAKMGISCHHVVGLGIPGENAFSHGEKLEYPKDSKLSDVIDLLEQRGNLCIYAHPNWSHSIHEELVPVEGLLGMEIYNHTTEVTRACGYSGSYYDRMLWEKKKLWCFACDDTHQKREDIGGGFIVVKAEAFNGASVINALQKGSFYASQGPEIFDFYVESGYACISCSPSRLIGFQSDTTRGGAGIDPEAGLTQAEHKLSGSESYVRGFCIDKYGRKAWTQPVYLDE